MWLPWSEKEVSSFGPEEGGPSVPQDGSRMGAANSSGDHGCSPWPAAGPLLSSCFGCSFKSLSLKNWVRSSSVVENSRLLPTESPPLPKAQPFHSLPSSAYQKWGPAPQRPSSSTVIISVAGSTLCLFPSFPHVWWVAFSGTTVCLA